MKKFMTLFLILLSLITTSCVTKPKSNYTIVLPPKPVHPEMNENPKSVKELGELINTYDSLVKEWEAWGEKVTRIIEEKNNDTDNLYQYLSW